MLNLNGCSVRMGTHEDADKILKLINFVQPNIPWTVEYFMWQFYGNQVKDSSSLYLILSGDEVVSLYAAVKKRCYLQGEIKEGVMIQDVMTHPDFRGRGFLNHLAKLCVNDIVQCGYYAYTFPNKLSENSFRRSRWTELAKIPLRTMKVNPYGKNFNVYETDLVEPVMRFDERVGKIWNDSGLLIGVYRNDSFLNWRYSRPETQYFKFYLKKEKGYLVLKKYDRENQKILHLLDIVVSKSSQDLIKPALEFIKEFASMNNASLINCWLPQGHMYAKIFDESGFFLDPDSDRFSFIMSPAKDFDFFSNASLWHLTQGDSDVY